MLLLALLLFLLTGCTMGAPAAPAASGDGAIHSAALAPSAPAESVQPETETAPAPEQQSFPANSETAQQSTSAQPNKSTGKVVVIDPGHQAQNDWDREPLGPGSQQTKEKMTVGTSGKTSGMNEYELNLQVSLKLQQELEDRGYTVVMTRTTNNVNLSNIQRAEIANKAQADAYIRVHANGFEKSSANGAMTLCPTAQNPYTKEIYPQCYALSQAVLEHLVEATGCKRERIWETDTMTGLNWSKVPVTLVEIGYMTNPEEDAKMATEAYQEKIAQGIANGVDAFLQEE